MSKTLYVDSLTKMELERIKPSLFSMVLFLRMLAWIWRNAEARQKAIWRDGFLEAREARWERNAE
jgi:hypothetical protein